MTPKFENTCLIEADDEGADISFTATFTMSSGILNTRRPFHHITGFTWRALSLKYAGRGSAVILLSYNTKNSIWGHSQYDSSRALAAADKNASAVVMRVKMWTVWPVQRQCCGRDAGCGGARRSPHTLCSLTDKAGNLLVSGVLQSLWGNAESPTPLAKQILTRSTYPLLTFDLFRRLKDESRQKMVENMDIAVGQRQKET